MAIIDLKMALMGVSMGFLAFLVIGALSGACAWACYPGQKLPGRRLQKLLICALGGFGACIASAYLGQFAGYFQSGQILEWVCVSLAACIAGIIFMSLLA